MQQIISSILAFIFSIFGIPNVINVNTLSPFPSPLIANKYEVEFNRNKYSVYMQKVFNPANLVLVPNFTDKLTSSEIMKKNNCKYGINGGFYTKDNKPLGLFLTDGKSINDIPHVSDLLNGYIYLDKQLTINNQQPAQLNNLIFLFQSGPYFTPNTKLNIIDDQPARRILVGESDKEEFYFLAITSFDNVHSGPLLADVPKIISKLNNQRDAIRYTLDALLNLDGGSASAFYSDIDTQLSELTPIGSFLCGK